jgi:hypothetical protein
MHENGQWALGIGHLHRFLRCPETGFLQETRFLNFHAISHSQATCFAIT